MPEIDCQFVGHHHKLWKKRGLHIGRLSQSLHGPFKTLFDTFHF